MALKTLNDFIDEHATLYPDNVDEATKAVIQSWYGYRKVAHNRYFPSWFYRTLVRDYPRYQEILRIEARTAGSEYDWLVTNYQEKQVELSGSNTGSINKTKTGTSSTNRTFTAGVITTTTDNYTDTTGEETTTKRTGTDTDALSRSLTHQETGSEQFTGNGTNNSVRTPDLRYELTGSDSTEQTGSNESVRTPDISTTQSSSGSDSTRHGSLQRQAPYDADYTGLTPGTNANVTSYVGESGVNTGIPAETDASGFMAGFPNLAIKNPTASADELSKATSIKYNKTLEEGVETTNGSTELSTTLDKSEVRTETGTDSTRITTTDTNNKALTKNFTDGGNQTNTKTLNLEDSVDSEGSVNHSGTTQVSKSGSDLDNVSVSNNGTETDSTTSTRKDVERTIFTGRSGQSPQFLLSDAVEFIKSTSAWLWLYRQIDKCFMMAYDLDGYEDYAEEI